MHLSRIFFLSITIILLESLAGFAQISTVLNDFDVDSVNNKIYVGGEFASYKGEKRTNLVCLSSTTGKVLSWNPNIAYSNKVKAIGYFENKVYIAGTGATNGFIEVYDSTGTLINSFTNRLQSIRDIRSMEIKGGFIYLTGDFNSNEQVVILDLNGNLVNTPQSFNSPSGKMYEVQVSNTKICLVNLGRIWIYNKTDYSLDTILGVKPFNIYFTDLKLDGDTLYAVGRVTQYKGGLKYDLKNKKQLAWSFYLISPGCSEILTDSTNYPCTQETFAPTFADGLAFFNNKVYVGGKIYTSKLDGNCKIYNTPLKVSKTVEDEISEFDGTKMFDNADRSIGKFKITNSTLFYKNIVE
ncbi:MAG TPA: hypothetical protein VFM99_08480, partial [Chitinophagales bacterium]|nr:hypothetical protein [Chitinophagales bacterium]